MKNSSYNVKSFFREIAVVVIGILIALFINNWNEAVKHKKFIDKTLYAIGKEIKYSKNDIETILPKHYQTIDALKSSVDNNQTSIKAVFVEVNGLQAPEVKNIGLRFFVSNNPELVDYEIISNLAEIEAASKGFERKLSKLMDLIYLNLSTTDEKTKVMIAELLTELVNSEEDLILLYENFLSKHEAIL